MPDYEDEDSRTIFVANLSEKVTEALLFELFLQGGPVEKVSQPKDKDGRVRTFAFITYVHAVSVPYAVNLFQGTQLFNRELTIKPRNNNNPNAQQRVEIPMLQPPHQSLMRNPFDINPTFNHDSNNRFDRSRDQYDQSSLRSSFNPVPTKASVQMQPQPSKPFNNHHKSNAPHSNDIEKLFEMGSNMIRQTDVSKRPTYDMLFTDRDVPDRHSISSSKMTNRHNNRSHYRDQPYSRRDGRDPPRHQQRSSGDRRRR